MSKDPFVIRETPDKNIVIESSGKRDSSGKRFGGTRFAIFDVDWTLIKPKEGRKFPQNVDDWQWLRKSVPETVRKFFVDGFEIIFLTDQSKPWKVTMIENVISVLDVDVTCLIAMNKAFHKPNPAFFLETFRSTLDGDCILDGDSSFFVGDAAGREGDWSRNDIDVAARIGVKFYTPEEVFPLSEEPVIGLRARPEEEVLIMVGYPASGKTTVAREMQEKYGYAHIDGDVFKTAPKMLKEAEKYVGTCSVIFDATNGTKERRKLYIDFARKHNLRVRCLWKTTPIDVSMEQNRERQKQGGPKVPDVVFYTYRKRFEEPNGSEEGCVVEKI
jgi:bifunctional polynucleotide phosphatase/kinase